MANTLRIVSSILTLLIACSFTFQKVDSKSVIVEDKIGQINNIFSSMHIDDIGVRMGVIKGYGQALAQEFFDEKNDIKVNFEMLMIDDKETKLLLTYQSNKTSLENYYIDLFEGQSSINLIVQGKHKKLKSVGWGSRYYNSKENKVFEALSFESIKEFAGKSVQLEIEDLTIYKERKTEYKEALWGLDFYIDQSAILGRESVNINKEFEFKGQTYKIIRMEFSPLETRLILTGSDILNIQDEIKNQYHVMSQLEYQFLTARKRVNGYGYTFDNSKSGVLLIANGERIVPIFSKGEVPSELGEQVLVFGPVYEQAGLTLQVGDSIKIPL
ncbi:hypothetical protein [Lysinibacillus sp. SGAir0095]|uniref:hypothetical protein n=1 Tax=Lysinibacillus sp. SGAir0095 TaxID=2070463 RepID=UPI0010CD60C7|nr:hypothetical protein [Lysinibacillus sp. SGAir0095]QCR33728.1 hypothetical protein C1N55_16900 [Lysinibacillus sp. SGAir0095]